VDVDWEYPESNGDRAFLVELMSRLRVYTNINQLFELCPNSAWTQDHACDNTVFSGNYGTGFKPIINKNGWYTQYDPIALVPFMLRVDGSRGYITYDDAFSIYFRVWYADWQRGLRGTLCGRSTPIMTGIRRI